MPIPKFFRRLPSPVVRLLKWLWACLWFFLYLLLAFILPSLWYSVELLCKKLITKFFTIVSSTSSPSPPETGAPGSFPPSHSPCLGVSADAHSDGRSGISSPIPIWDDPELSSKIREACAIARANGFRYIWIDSCCIDKSSSSELSEVINSMYSWYARAIVCYAYLADVPADEDHAKDHSCFRESRWFTRGWTLQELIAPLHVEFLAQDWTVIGTKHALVDLVQSVTKIDYKALLHLEPLDRFSVAQRLSWASTRKTTRVEDQAYSLLGIFDINMPTLYGEGERAFRRLQEAIMQRIPDQSLFAWGRVSPGSHLLVEPSASVIGQDPPKFQCVPYPESDSLLAMYPRNFENSGSIGAVSHNGTANARNSQFQLSQRHEIEYTSSPYGIRTKFRMVPLSQYLPSGSIQYDSPETESCQWFLAILECEHTDYPGHLLGRVCYVSPSLSGVDFLYPGYVFLSSFRGRGHRQLDLLSLSPETIERCRLHTELKTVHISHPGRTSESLNARYKPHKTIELVLLSETSNALRARGYTAVLRAEPSLPTGHRTGTHQLILSNHRHNITVAFQHTLWDGGERFTLDAEVKTLRPSLVDSAPAAARPWSFHGVGSPSASTATVSWTHASPWSALGHKRVTLNVAGAESLAVDLGMDFAGMGVYFLRIDVLQGALASPSPSSSGAMLCGDGRRVSGVDSDVTGVDGNVERGAEGEGSGSQASWRQLVFWRRRGQNRSVVGSGGMEQASADGQHIIRSVRAESEHLDMGEC